MEWSFRTLIFSISLGFAQEEIEFFLWEGELIPKEYDEFLENACNFKYWLSRDVNPYTSHCDSSNFKSYHSLSSKNQSSSNSWEHTLTKNKWQDSLFTFELEYPIPNTLPQKRSLKIKPANKFHLHLGNYTNNSPWSRPQKIGYKSQATLWHTKKYWNGNSFRLNNFSGQSHFQKIQNHILNLHHFQYSTAFLNSQLTYFKWKQESVLLYGNSVFWKKFTSHLYFTKQQLQHASLDFSSAKTQGRWLYLHHNVPFFTPLYARRKSENIWYQSLERVHHIYLDHKTHYLEHGEISIKNYGEILNHKLLVARSRWENKISLHNFISKIGYLHTDLYKKYWLELGYKFPNYFAYRYEYKDQGKSILFWEEKSKYHTLHQEIQWSHDANWKLYSRQKVKGKKGLFMNLMLYLPFARNKVKSPWGKLEIGVQI